MEKFRKHPSYFPLSKIKAIHYDVKLNKLQHCNKFPQHLVGLVKDSIIIPMDYEKGCVEVTAYPK